MREALGSLSRQGNGIFVDTFSCFFGQAPVRVIARAGFNLFFPDEALIVFFPGGEKPSGGSLFLYARPLLRSPEPGRSCRITATGTWYKSRRGRRVVAPRQKSRDGLQLPPERGKNEERTGGKPSARHEVTSGATRNHDQLFRCFVH